MSEVINMRAHRWAQHEDKVSKAIMALHEYQRQRDFMEAYADEAHRLAREAGFEGHTDPRLRHRAEKGSWG